jgi:hypothetical protein
MPYASSDFSTSLTLLVYGGIALVLIILVTILILRFLRRTTTGTTYDTIAQLDITAKGVQLTQEEKARIRAAQARLIARTTEEQARRRQLTPATLLADPEVLRLKEQARIAREEKRQLSDQGNLAQLEANHRITAPPSEVEPVELPPDVIKMAELGLITAEELDNIRERIRQKKSQLTG